MSERSFDSIAPRPRVIKPGGGPGEWLRLDRRRFLRGGAVTFAGIGGLTVGDMLRPELARAQSRGNVFNVRFHDELTTATPVRGDNDRLRLVRHVYEFDFRG